MDLSLGKRLGDVRFGANAQTARPRRLGGRRCLKDEEYRVRAPVAPELYADLEAVHVGEHDLQNNDSRVDFPREARAVPARQRLARSPAGSLENPSEPFAGVGVVLDDPSDGPGDARPAVQRRARLRRFLRAAGLMRTKPAGFRP